MMGQELEIKILNYQKKNSIKYILFVFLAMCEPSYQCEKCQTRLLEVHVVNAD